MSIVKWVTGIHSSLKERQLQKCFFSFREECSLENQEGSLAEYWFLHFTYTAYHTTTIAVPSKLHKTQRIPDSLWLVVELGNVSLPWLFSHLQWVLLTLHTHLTEAFLQGILNRKRVFLGASHYLRLGGAEEKVEGRKLWKYILVCREQASKNNWEPQSGHRKIIVQCWVGGKMFRPHAKWASKNFLANCHFPPAPGMGLACHIMICV